MAKPQRRVHRFLYLATHTSSRNNENDMHKQVSTQVLAVLAVVLLLSSPHLATGEDAVLKLDLKLDGEIQSLRFTPRDDLVQAAERFEHEQLRGVQGARRRPHRRRRRAK